MKYLFFCFFGAISIVYFTACTHSVHIDGIYDSNSSLHRSNL